MADFLDCLLCLSVEIMVETLYKEYSNFLLNFCGLFTFFNCSQSGLSLRQSRNLVIKTKSKILR